MRVAYIDCFSGVAGDMLLGALVDVGADRRAIDKALGALEVDPSILSFSETRRAGLRALHAQVDVQRRAARHNYTDLKRLLENAPLAPGVKRRALETFAALARAEGRVHGVAPEEVHWHEVGAVDALVDIVGTCAAVDDLQLDRIVCSPVATGTGEIHTEHGLLPLPAPAVVELLEAAGAPLTFRGSDELATPTGAALVATLADEFGSPPALRVTDVGYGAGTADRPVANVVRILVGEAVAGAPARQTVHVVEANLDDMSPELVAHAVDELLRAGAHDAWVTPIVMKKGRPAFTIGALVAPELEGAVTSVFFKETTTLGVRMHAVDRRVLEREWVRTEVRGVPVRVKIGRLDGRVATVSPEHDDAVHAARSTGLALREIYREAVREAEAALGERVAEPD